MGCGGRVTCKGVSVIASVREKCPRFCKCLRFLKPAFATFLDFYGCQKLPAFSASFQKSVMVIVTIYVEIIDKVYLIVHARIR